MQTRKWILALGVAACATGLRRRPRQISTFGLFRDHQLDAHSEQLFGNRLASRGIVGTEHQCG